MPALISAALHQAAQALSPVTNVPRLEAEILLAHSLKQSRSYLLARSNELLPYDIENAFFKLVTKRVIGQPIAYLIGNKEFWSLELKVTSDVLIPRPETELLVELILKRFSKNKIRLADLGTGSGAIALALAHERPAWEIFATDKSQAALLIAKENAEHLGIQNVTFLQGEWCHALPHIQLNVIVANPPYIAEQDEHLQQGDLRFEPASALVSGHDGMTAIRELIAASVNYLEREGALFLEHGYQQAAEIRMLFEQSGYAKIKTYNDLSGLERVTCGCILD